MQHKDSPGTGEVQCWWRFFHKWSIWVDTVTGNMQRRKCDKCGKTQERLI